MSTNDKPPLIMHVVHRLAMGGMENGLVNIINGMPSGEYRHMIVCMTESSDFERKIRKPDVVIESLHKKEGQDLATYWKMAKLIRKYKPDIIHTRNIATLEMQLVAALLGVKGRLHSEHGRDTVDLDGRKPSHLLLRRLLNPLVKVYIALSKDIGKWLLEDVGVRSGKVLHVYNGVPTDRFTPARECRDGIRREAGVAGEDVVIGTIGRFSPEKDQMTLLKAFSRLIRENSVSKFRARLFLVGDGPTKQELQDYIEQNDLTEWVWMPGKRDDVEHIYSAMDIFVLPSLIEGISNTILEAMSSALPVVATRVGGNAELVSEGLTGALVKAEDEIEMAAAVAGYVNDDQLRENAGSQGRDRVLEMFSIEKMISEYLRIYKTLS